MIYDTLDNLSQYEGLSPRIMTGLRFLSETDFSALPDGKVEVDGDRVTASLQRYDTRVENVAPEAHRAYADIQFVIEGEELIGVSPLSAMTEEAEAKPERDIWFYHGRVDPLLVTGKRFMVLWPGDAHAPGIAVDGRPAPVRKCVVKVKLIDSTPSGRGMGAKATR